MSYPLFSNEEYEKIEDIVVDCIFDFPDEVKITGECLYPCAECSIYDSVLGCNDRIRDEVIYRNKIMLKNARY